MRISDWSSDVCSSDLGDCDSVEQHQRFYDEYLSVMDLTAEFYLQTVRSVFQEHALPEGRLMHRGKLVDCRKIRSTALMTVEGEKDDICGLGQTEAAHDLCGGISAKNHHHYVQQHGRTSCRERGCRDV